MIAVEHFTGVGPQMALEARSPAYHQEFGTRRKDLTADFIQALAVQAGAEAGVAEAEGLLVLGRDGGEA